VLPAMQRKGAVVAWIVHDTSYPKKGQHSLGVMRQYWGQVGKQENWRVAVSLSVATSSSSLPIAYRLYLPKECTGNAKRREKVEAPQEIEFQIKPETALDQIRRAMVARVARGVVWLMSPKE
jgi:SRSO17 transposase